MALLKPAHTKENGYRIYEEPQLLTLQQILFYRELGFELRCIHEILSQRKFEKIAALKSTGGSRKECHADPHAD
jgi:DNA-binding transcriptional MerR regulator